MKKLVVVFAFLQIILLGAAQKKDTIPDLSKGNYVITNLKVDSVKERDRSSQALRSLKNGAVIVRLKTNQKSVDAYRKAGQNEIADKIEADRQKQNEKMYAAFERNFLFCKVYFIYASDTKQFLAGNRKFFLNRELQRDTTILYNDTNFVFCEYGTVDAFSKFNDYEHIVPARNGTSLNPRSTGNRILDTIPTETSTSPATTSGLFFSDKNLKQFNRPFPFVEGVYMENYDGPIRELNRAMERAYGRLVIRKDFNTKMKEEKKKQKQLLKSLQ